LEVAGFSSPRHRRESSQNVERRERLEVAVLEQSFGLCYLEFHLDEFVVGGFGDRV
jgi:hypothetical protein